MGAPSGLYFPRAVYNMAIATCHQEDISDTSDPKTNEWLNEMKRLLRIALKQQAEILASQHHAMLS
jgi:hypothetical protein